MRLVGSRGKLRSIAAKMSSGFSGSENEVKRLNTDLITLLTFTSNSSSSDNKIVQVTWGMSGNIPSFAIFVFT
jgi:hypothetical protein